MKVCENGVMRDLTDEEIAEMQSMQEQYAGETDRVAPTVEERIAALEEELAITKILLGVE